MSELHADTSHTDQQPFRLRILKGGEQTPGEDISETVMRIALKKEENVFPVVLKWTSEQVAAARGNIVKVVGECFGADEAEDFIKNLEYFGIRFLMMYLPHVVQAPEYKGPLVNLEVLNALSNLARFFPVDLVLIYVNKALEGELLQ